MLCSISAQERAVELDNQKKGKRVTKLKFGWIAIALFSAGLLLTSNVAAGPAKTADGSLVGGEGAEFDESSGKWVLESGEPTYRIKEDGTIDFLTFRGFQRYHAECHVCHGPEGVGSTYAPALTESLKRMDYSDFVGVVASGRVVHQPGGGESVMPALGDNKNVMCYLDGIYTYLKARSDDVLPRGRPKGKDPKPEALGEFENACVAG